MHFTPEEAALALGETRRVLALDQGDVLKIRHVWHSLILTRAHILAHMMRRYLGDCVYSGPFKGMRLTPKIMQGAYAPRLLGSYEHELHPAIERAIAHPFRQVLNVGCSFGYYSVGLARRMPEAQIHAFDIDTKAQADCRDLAALNQVQDRVRVGGTFSGDDFATYAGQETLLVMDVEGAELDLLDPVRYPALRGFPIIVELHDLFNPAISGLIIERFASSHDIELIHNAVLLPNLQISAEPNGYVDPFDRMILTWEDRDGPTPWAVMWPKK